MVHTGCGAEIARIIGEIPYDELIRTDDVASQLSVRLSMPYDKAKTATNVKLKRMADHGELKRLRRGVYCHIMQTVFGPVVPDIDRIVVRSITIENGCRIGYESGAVLLNRLGLSTLLPRTIEVTTNQYTVRLPDNCHIKLTKPAVTVTNDNWKYLQFIDAAEHLPDAHIDAEAPAQLLNAFAAKQELDPLKLIFTARKHYSTKTVLRLTDLLMEVNNESAPGQKRI